jgi:hypothetical protein
MLPKNYKDITSNAFGVVPRTTLLSFEEMYDNAKGNGGSQGNAVAILRQYDVSSSAPQWTERFLPTFTVPNMEDPIRDGMSKDVYKDAMFKSVFDNDKVVFKVARHSKNDNLGMHSRSVHNMALVTSAATEFNSSLPEKKFHIKFCDSIIIELLSETIDLPQNAAKGNHLGS